jgi:mRNA-degrading endonuclease RelE of RelBE toxin-antitoxin system
LNYKIAFKKSVSRDLKKIDKEQAKRILNKIESELPQKAETLPTLTGKFSG